MTTQQWLTHAAEIYTNEGPTGKIAYVTRGQVRDFGGNVLFSGSADECVAFSETLRAMPFRLTPTTWEEAGEVAGADVTWQCVVR